MELVQITPKASQDIAKLAQGVDRTQVALEALKGANLTGKQVKQLEALLKKVALTESASTDTQAQAVSEIKNIRGRQAVVGQISVKGQQLDTLLTEASFNTPRADQIIYAETLGYRLATRAENRAYVKGLLAKEHANSINEAEKNALHTYRERYVRDTQGALDVTGQRIHAYLDYCDAFAVAYPPHGALFVRASAESK